MRSVEDAGFAVSMGGGFPSRMSPSRRCSSRSVLSRSAPASSCLLEAASHDETFCKSSTLQFFMREELEHLISADVVAVAVEDVDSTCETIADQCVAYRAVRDRLGIYSTKVL